MKIGIFVRDTIPGEGGASAFINTIINSTLEENLGKFELIFVYRGSRFGTVSKIIKGCQYLNLRAYEMRKLHILFNLSLKAKIKNINRKLKLLKIDFFEKSSLDLLAKEYGIDAYWFTWPTHEVLSTPYIYTLWDLGHRMLPMLPEVSSPLSEWNRREYMYQTMVYRASYIITGNETGKNEIITNYNISSEKVKVVPFPISSFCFGDEVKPRNIPDSYFFYPAQFWSHKNHICIINALEILKEKYSWSPFVVFTGTDKGNLQYINEEARKRGVNKQIFNLGFVKDSEIKYLYTHAIGMIYASLMGPNNLPPIESAYLLCPVIITDIKGHKEQMGKSALYFNGYEPDTLAECMYKLAFDNNIRNECIKNEKEIMINYKNFDYINHIKMIFYDLRKNILLWKNV